MRLQGWAGQWRRAGVLGMSVWLVLAVGLESAAGGPSVARAAMLTVCPSGCAYTRIQAALVAAAPGDTIGVGVGSYAEHLSITKNVILRGVGAGSVVVDGGGSDRVVTVVSGVRALLVGLTIQHGSSASSGGGISTSGTLVLVGVRVISNTVTAGTGPTCNGDDAAGGGIANSGALTLISSTVAGNTASAGSSFAGNGCNGGQAFGGGIANYGALTLLGSGVTANGAQGNFSYYASGGAGYGGGIYNEGALTLAYSVVAGNTAQGGRSAYYSAAGFGGGIASLKNYPTSLATLVITASTISGNQALGAINYGQIGDYPGAGRGGGLALEGGTATMSGSTVSGNLARGGDAGGSAYTGISYGGGIDNDGAVVTATNSTVSGNWAQPGGNGQIKSSYGGGISNGATLTLANVTVSGNTAVFGGGLNPATAATALRNSIVALNISAAVGASHSPDCYGSLVSQGYNLLGDNAGCQGLSDGVNGDQVGTDAAPRDPLLSPLGSNGGPTMTRAPLPGSPALAAGNPAGCTDAATGAVLTADQRGYPRPAPTGSRCDLGAVESQAN